MLALLAAGVLAATVQPAACPRVACVDECWSVHVRYVVNVAADGARPAWRTGSTLDGGLWGSWTGAACHSRRLIRDGVWIEHPADPARRMLVPATDASPGAVLDGDGRERE